MDGQISWHWHNSYLKVTPMEGRTRVYMKSDLKDTLGALIWIFKSHVKSLETVFYYRMEDGVALAWGTMGEEDAPPLNLGGYTGVGNGSTPLKLITNIGVENGSATS